MDPCFPGTSYNDNCVFCGKLVRKKQEALQCDVCDLWQHRQCKTGLSKQRYWALVDDDADDYAWTCFACTQAAATDVVSNMTTL